MKTLVRVVIGLMGVAFVAGVVLAARHRATMAPTVAPTAEWVSLFDGKTLAHWRGFNKTGVPSEWAVEDAAITRVGEGVDLITIEEFDNFEFEFEWRLPAGGNSGVLYRVSEGPERTHHTGPEFQVLDNTLHADGKNPLTSAGADYALHPPSMDMTRPIGEWNQGRIVADGPHVEHWLNGMKVVEYELWTPEWIALVRASKFNEWPGFGLNRKGHLALQEHEARVQYRNLRVRRLQ